MNLPLLRSFLDDIKSHPLDDIPRLILADWLEEHGETEADRARAQLIRMQCAAAQAGEDAEETPELAEDREQFIKEHLDAWTAPLTDTIDRGFTRGLLTLTATRQDIVNSPLLDPVDHPNFLWLDELLIEEYEPRDVDMDEDWFNRLLSAPVMQHPRVFSLRGVNLSTPQIRRLARWPGFQRLRSLSLFGADTSDDHVETLLGSPHLGPLRRLRLSRGRMGTASLTYLLQHKRLIHLVDLDVGWNDIGPEPLPLLADAVFRPQLQGLSLWSNPLGNVGVEHLQQLHLPALTRLDLGFCNLGPEAMEHLVSAPWVAQLEELHLPSNPLGDGILTLVQAPVSRLRKLRLNFGSLDRAHVGELVRSPNLANLRDVSIYSNSLGPGEMRLLTQNWALRKVRNLDLCMNAVGDEGLQILADWPGLAQFHSLDLSHTSSTDVGLRAILASPHLQPKARLTLYGNNPSEELRQEAAARTPAIEL